MNLFRIFGNIRKLLQSSNDNSRRLKTYLDQNVDLGQQRQASDKAAPLVRTGPFLRNDKEYGKF